MVKKIVKWYSNYKIHVLIWLSYMTYEAFAVGIFFGDFKSPIIYLSHYTVVVSLFYFHSDFILPNATKNKNITLYLTPLFIVAELVIYLLFQYLVTVILIYMELTLRTETAFSTAFIIRNIYRGILFIGFSTGYYFLRNYLKERKKVEEFEKERLKNIIQQQKDKQELVIAQNAMLKAQINPHFLFNTLDFVYHKVNVHSEIAGDSIIKLAEMMRFAIDSDGVETTIQLQQEIEQVENLLYLYQMRKADDLNVYFEYDEEVKKLYFVPLVIITLVENIFKHGDISMAEEIAYIGVIIVDGVLQIRTSNLINFSKTTRSHHSGLNNIKKRLNYTYGKCVSFDCNTVGQHFEVQIKIPVQLLKTAELGPGELEYTLPNEATFNGL